MYVISRIIWLFSSASVETLVNTSLTLLPLQYQDCLSLVRKVKIAQVAHHCKCNKGKVAVAQAEHKQQLVQQLAKSYKAFGQSLGHYLQADIVGCLKEKK